MALRRMMNDEAVTKYVNSRVLKNEIMPGVPPLQRIHERYCLDMLTMCCMQCQKWHACIIVKDAHERPTTSVQRMNLHPLRLALQTSSPACTQASRQMPKAAA